MAIENSYIGISAVLVVLYFLGMGMLKTNAATIHFYDSYYVLSISFISLLLLMVAVVDVVIYKIFRFSAFELSPSISIAQFMCTIFFFSLVLYLTFSGSFIRTSSLAAILVSFVVSQLLFIAIYFYSVKRV